jgi:2-dehydropantoate 2-reductase
VTGQGIVVVGPGAIGTLMAAAFAAASYPVTILDKYEERAARLNRLGLTVYRRAGTRIVSVRAVADTATIPPPEFCCLCVKSFDTADALRHAQPLLQSCSAVISLQNGVGNAEKIAALAGADRAVCAVTSYGATRVRDGVVREAGAGLTWVAPWTAAGKEAAERFASLLRSAGCEVAFADNPAPILWSKLAVNAAVNPLTALHRVMNGRILDGGELQSQAFAAAREVEAVAAKLGVSLLYGDATEEVRRVCQRTAGNVSSMLQDVLAGRRTEIEAINGAVVSAARLLGMPVPVNEELVRRVLSIPRSDP